MKRTSRLAALVVAGVLGTACLAACAPAHEASAGCVPALTVTPADPDPGEIVTVTTSRACRITLPEGAVWKVRIRPADAPIPLAQASVRPDDDGSFTLSITVPPTMPEGPAIVWIDNYTEFAPCADSDDCAQGRFTVGPNLN